MILAGVDLQLFVYLLIHLLIYLLIYLFTYEIYLLLQSRWTVGGVQILWIQSHIIKIIIIQWSHSNNKTSTDANDFTVNPQRPSQKAKFLLASGKIKLLREMSVGNGLFERTAYGAEITLQYKGSSITKLSSVHIRFICIAIHRINSSMTLWPFLNILKPKLSLCQSKMYWWKFTTTTQLHCE